MCGLFFLYDQNLSREAMLQVADAALNVLRHRGPDDAGKWTNAPVLVGHRRLSIIDLGGSRQPMTDAEQRFVLSYNGEIYNYRELRKRLAERWQFRTDGDTEVLLAGLATYGRDFCQQMEGMWAFALWDQRARTLLLGRDRMGKKPLYYRVTREGFACASELPALATLTAPWQEDLDSTADYLRYGYCLPGTTAYRDVFELLPGHTATWRPKGRIEQSPYWALRFGHFDGDKEQAGECLNASLIRAVDRRLVADVEVGAFLSGGIDSSLLVELMAHALGRRPKTFTIGFAEASFDETRYARLVAQHCGTDHYEERLDVMNRDALEQIIFEHVGQPFADPSLLPTALVARLAARHVKVALSGDGGDELFSGYQRYQARVLMRWYTRLPLVMRKNLEKLLRAIPEPMTHHSGSLLKKAQMFCDTVQRAEDEQPYTVPSFYSLSNFARLAPALAHRGHTPPGLPQRCGVDDIHAMMAADALIYLPQDVLTKVDRATMAYSLEARAPFLDTAVVELAFSLPRHWHRRGLSGKRLLRETFFDRLPATIWRRRKQGFSVPINQWFRTALGDVFRGLLKEQPSLLDVAYVENMLEAHRAGRKDYSYQLWTIYIYLMWQRANLLQARSDAENRAVTA